MQKDSRLVSQSTGEARARAAVPYGSLSEAEVLLRLPHVLMGKP